MAIENLFYFRWPLPWPVCEDNTIDFDTLIFKNQTTNVICWLSRCCCYFCWLSSGKHPALSHRVMCDFRLYLKLGRTNVKPSWKHWIFMSHYRCLHTEVPYNTTYNWNSINVKAHCSLFTYNMSLHQTGLY